MAEYKYYFRYGFIETWEESLLHIIGASDLLNSEDIEEHNEYNSVYVSWDGSDDTSADGTESNPFRTIQYAKDMLYSDQTIITILDSNYYYTGDAIDLYFDLDGITLQGVEGEKPTLLIDTSIANQISMIRLQNGGNILNVEIQIDTSYSEQVTAIDAREGTIKNVTINSANKYGIQKSTSGIVSIYNTIIKNSINDGTTDGSGIYVSEGELNIDHCLIYGNDYAGIHFYGTGIKIVNLEHCTISSNQYGIRNIDSSNLTLTVNNSIVYRNNVYDHYGIYGDYSYSCIGKVQGNPGIDDGEVVVRNNPLFVSYEDFRLRSKYNGIGDELLTSPCLGISDNGGDLGVYEYNRVLSGQVYTEFEVTPPIKVSYIKSPVDSSFITTNTLKNKMIVRGFLNQVSLSWNGDDNALTELEFLDLKNMFESEGFIYMSTDNEITYNKYLIDKTRGISSDRAINKENNTLILNTSLILYEA